MNRESAVFTWRDAEMLFKKTREVQGIRYADGKRGLADVQVTGGDQRGGFLQPEPIDELKDAAASRLFEETAQIAFVKINGGGYLSER